MQFKTSLDTLAKTVTWGGCGIFALLSAQQVFSYLRSPREPVDVVVAVLAILGFLSIPLCTYLFSPLGYSVRAGALVIHRPLRSLVIPLEEIRKVQILTPEAVSSSFRVFGVGGLFGYYGLFFRTNLGGYVRFYLRNRENPILLDTKQGKLLLSPDSPGLVHALSAT
jgi:hypothetical protein